MRQAIVTLLIVGALSGCGTAAPRGYEYFNQYTGREPATDTEKLDNKECATKAGLMEAGEETAVGLFMPFVLMPKQIKYQNCLKARGYSEGPASH